jgi:hypothetical protein
MRPDRMGNLRKLGFHVPGKEDAEGADRRVEAVRREPQVLHVPFEKFHIACVQRGGLPCGLVQHATGKVHARHAAPRQAAGHGQSSVARARGNIEHLFIAPEIEPCSEQFCAFGKEPERIVVVSGRDRVESLLEYCLMLLFVHWLYP